MTCADVTRLEAIVALAQLGNRHSSKAGQDFLDKIEAVAKGELDPANTVQQMRDDYPEDGPEYV